MRVNQQIRYQTIESFGTSGGWWAQYIGLWDWPCAGSGGQTARERIISLLFDPKDGIGLTGYRYNIGAGSADSGRGNIEDVHRRAQSFETAPGIYDWSKDEGAVWVMERAVEMGVQEVTMFICSPLERLTRNGLSHMTRGGEKINIDPVNYVPFARYACDVVEHFIQKGIPVKFLSPVNEPQWEWVGTQEGCSFEPQDMMELDIAFLRELSSRSSLSGVCLAGPESGQWGGRTTEYVGAMLSDESLRHHLRAIDGHSYWSNREDKAAFRAWLVEHAPGMAIRMSEWCELVSGTDPTMDSAIVLAKTLAEDLSVLNAVSWATWRSVSPLGYHDGLIHAESDGQGGPFVLPLKRLWAYGNYTRFIRPGFTRVQVVDGDAFSAVAFAGTDDGVEKLVVVVVNDGDERTEIDIQGNLNSYHGIEMYETSKNHDLERVSNQRTATTFSLAPRSVTTIIFS